MEGEKNYLKWSAKTFTFNNGNSIIKVSIHKDALNNLKPNEKGYVKFIVAKRKEEDQWGNDMMMYEDTYVPDPSKVKEHVENKKAELPF